jgi:hypothetical protein
VFHKDTKHNKKTTEKGKEKESISTVFKQHDRVAVQSCGGEGNRVAQHTSAIDPDSNECCAVLVADEVPSAHAVSTTGVSTCGFRGRPLGIETSPRDAG